MSDTPKTDAACFPMNAKHPYVATEFARKLERERNEWAAMCGTYKQERDEAREALSSREVVIAQHSVITDLILERDKWSKLCGQYKQERDEAREAARRYLTELKNNGH